MSKEYQAKGLDVDRYSGDYAICPARTLQVPRAADRDHNAAANNAVAIQETRGRYGFIRSPVVWLSAHRLPRAGRELNPRHADFQSRGALYNLIYNDLCALPNAYCPGLS